jgi:hypothetical protein
MKNDFDSYSSFFTGENYWIYVCIYINTAPEINVTSLIFSLATFTSKKYDELWPEICNKVHKQLIQTIN